MDPRVEAMRRALAFVNGPLGAQDHRAAEAALAVFDRELKKLRPDHGGGWRLPKQMRKMANKH